jgi:hypothetical protein
MENNWIKGRKGAVAPVLTVAVLFIFHGLVMSIFIECERGIAKCEPFSASYIFTLNPSNPLNEKAKTVNGEGQDRVLNRKLIAERYNGRLVWVFFVAISAMLCLASFFAAGRLIYNSSSFRNESAATRVTACTGLSLLCGSLLFFFPRSYMPLFEDILEDTIAKQEQFGMPVVFGTTNLINALTYAAAFMLMFASCAILLPREGVSETYTGDEYTGPNETDKAVGEDSKDAANRFAVVSEQMKDLRIVLYFGTFLLILGVIRMSAVSQWTLAFIAPDAVDAAKSFYVTLSSITGGFNSLIIAAIYLPAAYILQMRAQLIAKELHLPPDKQEETLGSKGLTFSFREALPRILAILGPLLAGPIGELFKVFTT